jgi:hypothetical protein
VIEQFPLGHLTLVRAFMRAAIAPPDAADEAPLAAAKPTLEVEARHLVEAHGTLHDAPGAWRPFHVDLTIKAGWHLNANPALLRFLVPTEVKRLRGELRGVRYPAADRYEGRVRIEGEVEVSGEGEASIVLSYQACDETRCLAPVTVEVALR